MMSAPTVSRVGSFPLNAKNITPSDATTYAGGITVMSRSEGNVAVEPLGGGDPVTYPVTAGGWVSVVCRRVLATGTTATDLIGHY
jgi:hypothetical protein